ncbi:MAG: hypothetical protein ACP5D6_06340 [Kosmotogaceae bacterium]
MDKAYEVLGLATEEYRDQAEYVRQLDRDLKLDILEAYAEERISGKNQTQRDAAEYALFKDRIDELEKAKHEEAETYREKEIAEIEVRYLHDILRVKEIAQTKE